MAEPKICNLDLISPIQPRQLVLGGETYDVKPLTVQSFIEFNKIRQKISKGMSIEDSLKLSQQMIRSAIPTMPEDLINQLTIGHLQYIVMFINDEIPDEILNGSTTVAEFNKKIELEAGQDESADEKK